MIVCSIFCTLDVMTEIFGIKGRAILHNIKVFIKTENKPVCFFLISKKYEKGKGIIAKNLINL